ncbi:phosphotransferase [Chitinophaga sp. Mgbs1]|uniref:Phosphotransferase n=1 Tax=Chitinophaga solisilvae TaxID=1233460 RepID=A0A3S1DRW2_9BACT|nr:phosphotransferase [Chitinophaga solisilvae]
MTIFPVQFSTLRMDALQQYVHEKYDLAGFSWHYIQRGASGDAYRLEKDNTRFFFKVYRHNHRSPEEIKAEIQLLDILQQQGANVVYALKDNTGNTIQTFAAPEGERCAVLFTFAAGARAGITLTDEQLAAIGVVMARNHLITQDLQLAYPRPEYNIHTTVHEPLRVLQAALTGYGCTTEYRQLADTAPLVLEKLAKLCPEQFSTGYCHFDYFPHNYYFRDDNTVTLFDFDFSGKGYLVYDIATLFAHYEIVMYLQRITPEEGRRAMELLLASYRKIKPLPAAEEAAIPLLAWMLLLFYLQFQHESYEYYSHTYFNRKFIQDRVAFMQHLAAKYEVI